MRLIDADALKRTFCAECNHSIKCDDCDIDYHFNHAPTVDAEEVVRCKDCKWWQGEDEYCDYDLVGGPNDYCAWGERKDEID